MSAMRLVLCAVTPSVAILAAWLVTTLAVAVQTRREERHLLDSHCDPYCAYGSKVGRFLPAVGRLT